MDPNANLDEQLRVTAEINAIEDACPDDGRPTPDQRRTLAERAGRLAELVEALDGWIVGGGFMPARWERGGRA